MAPINSDDHFSSFTRRSLYGLVSARTDGSVNAATARRNERLDDKVTLIGSEHLFTKREDKAPNNFDKGNGVINPYTVNNKGMLWLFALLFAALVLAAIWFFFWAKNGGFKFQKGDWDEYKSTVLRRKGPDGKTLSGATSSAKLGDSSINGEFDDRDMYREHLPVRDADIREYRHEKPARVGGLNRKPDGSYYDHTNTDRSTVTFDPVPQSSPQQKEKEKTSWFSRAKKAPKKNKVTRKTPRQPSTTYSFTTGDDSTIISNQSSRGERHGHKASRAPPPRRQNHPRRSSRHSSPARRSGPQYTYRDRAPAYQPSEAPSYMYSEAQSQDTGDYGTKSYRHVIPGLSAGSRSDAAEERRVDRGFRRGGGGGRRDSLSDSDGETRR